MKKNKKVSTLIKKSRRNIIKAWCDYTAVTHFTGVPEAMNLQRVIIALKKADLKTLDNPELIDRKKLDEILEKRKLNLTGD